MAKLTSAQLKVVAKRVLEGIKDTHNANNEALLVKNKAKLKKGKDFKTFVKELDKKLASFTDTYLATSVDGSTITIVENTVSIPEHLIDNGKNSVEDIKERSIDKYLDKKASVGISVARMGWNGDNVNFTKDNRHQRTIEMQTIVDDLIFASIKSDDLDINSLIKKYA